MFLMIGSFLMALGLVLILHLMVFKKVPKTLNYFIIFVIGFAIIITLNVHGIWLGLMIIIVGFLWIKFFIRTKSEAA